MMDNINALLKLNLCKDSFKFKPNFEVLEKEFSKCKVINIGGSFQLNYIGKKIFPLFCNSIKEPIELKINKQNSYHILREIYILQFLYCTIYNARFSYNPRLNENNIVKEHPGNIKDMVNNFYNEMEKFGHYNNIDSKKLFVSISTLYLDLISNKDIILSL